MENGTVVAFTQEVNEAFVHSVMPHQGDTGGQRVVVVIWGWREQGELPADGRGPEDHG